MRSLLQSVPTGQPARQLHPWQELAVLALLGMELSWVGLWYSGLSQTGRAVPYPAALAVLGIILIGAHFLARYFALRKTGKWRRRGIFAALVILSLYFTLQTLLYWPDRLSPLGLVTRVGGSFAQENLIPGEFWVMLAVLLIWRRGVTLAQRTVSVDTVTGSFQVGILAFFACAIFPPLAKPGVIGPALALFLVLGLTAMSAARIHEAGYGRGGRQRRFSQGWLLGILLTALVLTALALGLSTLAQGPVAGLVGRLFWILLTLLLGLAFLLVIPLILLLVAIEPWLKQLLGSLALFAGLMALEERLRELFGSLTARMNFDNIIHQVEIAKPALLAGVLILALVSILAGLSLRVWLQREPAEEGGEELLTGGELLESWRSALRRRLERLRSLSRRGGLGSAERALAAARIRWIYRQMEKLGADLGQPRPPAATPLEFLPSLQGALPQAGTAAGVITQAYLRVRYGELPESRSEVAEVLAAWDVVKHAGRRKGSRKTRKER